MCLTSCGQLADGVLMKSSNYTAHVTHANLDTVEEVSVGTFGRSFRVAVGNDTTGHLVQNRQLTCRSLSFSPSRNTTSLCATLITERLVEPTGKCE